jgi:dTMP kinase
MIITFEGGDGCGKSSQLKLLEKRLSDNGYIGLSCYEPGFTPLGERVRDILLGEHGFNISSRTEMLLFMAARSQLVEDVIRPAEADGKIILCDRFSLSTIVYQGVAGGLPVEEIQQVNHIATNGLIPDIAFVLDVPYEVAQQRLQSSRAKLDRMESKGEEFHRKVREGFLSFARLYPKQYTLIDASGSIEEVESAIWKVTDALLREKFTPGCKQRIDC